MTRLPSPVLLVVCTTLSAAVLAAGRVPAPATTQPLPTPTPVPDPFATWPRGAKPDAVLVLSGQTYGYLQPSGATTPPLGGLERRANLVKSIRDRGWPVAGFDLGDVPPVAAVVPDQLALKYATTMNALREMGYVAVGAGRAEFANGVFHILGQYAGKKEQPPYTLAGNVGGALAGKVLPRADTFIGPGTRAMVGLVEVADAGAVPVGVAGVVGPSVQKAVAALGPKTLVGFTPEKDALDAAVKQLAAHPKKPALNVLLYQGTAEEAKKAVKDYPQFRVVLALSSRGDPPDAETLDGPDGAKPLLVQVGYKGRHVGVVGAFKRADGGFDLKYESVPLGPGFDTPGSEDAARKANAILPLLDDYAEAVRNRGLLTKFPQYPPPGSAENPKLELAYVGSEACAKCHPAEHAKWKATPHAHAFESLEKAKRPALRQYDGECVFCHAVGLGYKTGFRDEKATPGLKHVGCESCHGPGSAHAADPKNLKLLALQSPWRKDKDDRLPDAAAMAALAKSTPADRERALKPGEWRAAVAVGAACALCHDGENDPDFDLFVSWPKVAHPAAKK